MAPALSWAVWSGISLALSLAVGAINHATAAPASAYARPDPSAPLQRVAQLRSLQQLTIRAAAEASGLADQSRRLRAALAQAQQAASAAQAAAPAAGSCSEPLQAADDALRLRLAEAQAAQAASLTALAAVAQSTAAQVGDVAQRADRALAARMASEAALQAAVAEFRASSEACEVRGRAADAVVRRATAAQHTLQREAAALPERSRKVQALWTDAKAAAVAAAERGLLPAPAVTRLSANFQDAPIESLAGPGWLRDAAAPTASVARSATLRRVVDIGMLAERRARLADAMAMADALSADCDGAVAGASSAAPGTASAAAPPSGCALFAAQAADRTGRAAALARVLQDELAAVTRATELTRAQAAAQQAATAAAAAQVAAQAASVDAAAAAADSIATQAGAAARQLRAQVEPALELAERQAGAGRVARLPSRPGGEGSGTGPGSQPATAAPSMTAPGPPVLAGHAWEFFDALNGERAGFGAYTYVLLRSAGDLKQPAVLRRYARVLDVVQRERRVAAVASSEAPFINLFCIPGQEGGGTASELARAYDDDLSLQLLFRAQSGLLTRPEMKRRLRDSTGPFLLTLPVRVGDARSDTALLFADLSLYPDDAIADLVNQYKGTLLVDFPRQQAAWKPPVPQRVALVMIGLASDVGSLVMSVMPAALAGER